MNPMRFIGPMIGFVFPHLVWAWGIWLSGKPFERNGRTAGAGMLVIVIGSSLALVGYCMVRAYEEAMKKATKDEEDK